MKRLLLALSAALVALLLAEGALSLLAHRSLVELAGLRRASSPAPRPARPATPDERATPGLYRAHPDPRVGYVFKPDADLAIFDGKFHTDALGLRRRDLPARGPDALQVIVLGDSVAFGHGLDDEQTLAHQLELLLASAAAGVPGARSVECRTVAVPGWNHRNAVWFLLDHLEQLHPDVVVYLPIANDTRDTDGVDELGNRRVGPDACSRDPWLSVNQVSGVLFARHAAEAVQAAGKKPWEWMGPDAVMADISPESRRRYDENLESIRTLAQALDRRGARLLLLQWTDVEYAWHLRRRLVEQQLDIPVLPLLQKLPADLTLGYDSHPNGEAIAGVARWVAADLLARGWAAGDPAAIPPASPAVQAARAHERPVAEILQDSSEFQWNAWAWLRPVVDFQTYEGVGQIYGGLNADGTAGARVLVMLPRAGATLSVRLAGVESQPDLYPLDVAVEIDGRPAGTLHLQGAAEVEAQFEVPLQAQPAPPIEVRLIPASFGVAWSDEQGWACVSFRPIRLRCGPSDGGAAESAPRPPLGTPYPAH